MSPNTAAASSRLDRKGEDVGRHINFAPFSIEGANRGIVGEHDSHLTARRFHVLRGRGEGVAHAKLRPLLLAPKRGFDDDLDRRDHGASCAGGTQPFIPSCRAPPRAARAIVGIYNSHHQFVPNDIIVCENDMTNSLDSRQQPYRLGEAGALPDGRSTWLGSPVTIMRLFSPSLVRNIFICIGVVFCASSRMTDCVRQGAAAHEGERVRSRSRRSAWRVRRCGHP